MSLNALFGIVAGSAAGLGALKGLEAWEPFGQEVSQDFLRMEWCAKKNIEAARSMLDGENPHLRHQNRKFAEDNIKRFEETRLQMRGGAMHEYSLWAFAYASRQ